MHCTLMTTPATVYTVFVTVKLLLHQALLIVRQTRSHLVHLVTGHFTSTQASKLSLVSFLGLHNSVRAV